MITQQIIVHSIAVLNLIDARLALITRSFGSVNNLQGMPVLRLNISPQIIFNVILMTMENFK